MLFVLLACSDSFAQNPAENKAAEQVVRDFFEAFHRQDSVALRNLAHPAIVMQSVGANAAGETKLSTLAYGNFLKSIISIPSNTKFEEKLHSFEVQVNGPLAHVVTQYSFYLNNNLSHCGVNAFTLVKEERDWKITHLVDTRNKENCMPKDNLLIRD